MERFFWGLMTDRLGERAGRQFIAITDPGTALDKLAATRRLSRDVHQPGGHRRPVFGAVAVRARANGVDRRSGARSARGGQGDGRRLPPGESRERRVRARRVHRRGDAGGPRQADGGPAAIAGDARSLDRTADRRSTGKHGKGALPVVDEPLGGPDEYGQDRAFVAIATDRDAPDSGCSRRSKRPDIRSCASRRGWTGSAPSSSAGNLRPRSPAPRWTSIRSTSPTSPKPRRRRPAPAGAYAKTHRLPETEPLARHDHLAVHTRAFAGRSPADIVRAALTDLKPGRLRRVPLLSARERRDRDAIAGIRRAIRRKTRVASTFGVGPRYLHSTGQYHKGGPNTVAGVRDHRRRSDRRRDSGGGLLVLGA